MKYLAPAKINLVLEVLGKRDDGYHELRSLVQTISLCDALSFKLAGVISLECNEPSLQTSDNLAIRAAELLRQVSGCQKGARIKLQKRIPWGAGLGGGSSDAATTLVALNRLWELKLKTSELIELAARLGSDVPFFIHGGAGLVEGRGEKVTSLAVSTPRWFVLLIPPLPKIANKTQRLYSCLGSQHFTDGQLVDRAVISWSKDKLIASSLLFNVFDSVAFDAFPGLKDYWRRFAEAGAENIHLAGSGAALFAPVNNKSRVKEIQRQLRQQKLESYAVSTIIKIAA
ncbi:MAG: 4-(cytidine 5'-diphospho)-2-C-methyl-D-erythritol kinase [Dehalococcoidia bacterium]|nr:4-(cytidine 5'-diphospho)-2-C-methyl-D-erythritol kinase [Dehalococcoidia bacterium]